MDVIRRDPWTIPIERKTYCISHVVVAQFIEPTTARSDSLSRESRNYKLDTRSVEQFQQINFHHYT